MLFTCVLNAGSRVMFKIVLVGVRLQYNLEVHKGATSYMNISVKL